MSWLDSASLTSCSPADFLLVYFLQEPLDGLVGKLLDVSEDAGKLRLLHVTDGIAAGKLHPADALGAIEQCEQPLKAWSNLT